MRWRPWMVRLWCWSEKHRMPGLRRWGRPLSMFHITFPSHSRLSSGTQWTSSRDHRLYFQDTPNLGTFYLWAELSALQFWPSVTLPLPECLWMLKSQRKGWALWANSGRRLNPLDMFFTTALAGSARETWRLNMEKVHQEAQSFYWTGRDRVTTGRLHFVDSDLWALPSFCLSFPLSKVRGLHKFTGWVSLGWCVN